MPFVMIFISSPDRKTAEKIGMHLLENKLAACISILPAKSMYWWKGKIESADEHIAIAKTTERNFARIIEETKKIHPYECPEIMKLQAEANKEYESWLSESVMENGSKYDKSGRDKP